MRFDGGVAACLARLRLIAMLRGGGCGVSKDGAAASALTVEQLQKAEPVEAWRAKRPTKGDCVEVTSGEHEGRCGEIYRDKGEDEEETEVTVSQKVLSGYRETLNRYCGGLREYCVRRDITHMLVDTSTDLDVLLMEYFRRRGLLR